MEEFEKLLEAERVSVERFVRFRLNSKADADDVLQEVFLAACQKFAQLKNKDFFKAWIISIARKYSLQGTTQGRYLTGGVPPVRFSM